MSTTASPKSNWARPGRSDSGMKISFERNREPATASWTWVMPPV